MKKYMFIMACIFFSLTFSAGADDFLGAPLISNGKIVIKTDTMLEMTTAMTHDQVLEFYKDALAGQSDIKYRDWKEATYIEDDGNLAWHSITIQKAGIKGTTITIAKDSWTWIIGTLVLRFVGVFIVLSALFLGMSVSGKIISKTLEKAKAK